MKILAIAAVNLRRTLRERTNMSFLFLFPMLMILVLGVAFGGDFTPRIGLVVGDGGVMAQELGDAIRAADGIDARPADDIDAVVRAVERGELEAAVVIPAGYDQAVRKGQTAQVRYLVRPGRQGQQVGSIISGVVDEQSGLLRAARFAQQETGVSFDEGRDRASAAAASLPRTTVFVSHAGRRPTAANAGRFDTGASSQLVLFLFITALTGSAALIESRRLGVSRRMLATPTRTWHIVAGEGLGRLAVAAVQAVVITVGSALVFGVNWGDPLAASLLVLAFSLVATGAGLLMGALARNTQQALAMGLLAGLGMGALGGTMMPLEFFSPTMSVVAHFTPHAWAVEGFATLVNEGVGVSGIARPLGVLFGTSLVLLVLASWSLRRSITH